MIKFIKHILHYFYAEKTEEQKQETNNINEEADNNILSLHFVFDNSNIDIYCDLFYDNSLSYDSIANISEKYAQILLNLNYGLLNTKLSNLLKEESKNTEDPKKVLLIDNIFSFYELHKKEMMKNSSLYKHPLVSPSSVFSSYQ